MIFYRGLLTWGPFFLEEMEEKKKFIELGYCRKPHGIKGGLSLALYNSDESHLAKGVKVTLFGADSHSKLKPEGEIFTIERIDFGNKVICYLKEIKDRNHLEALLPFSIKMDRKDFKPPKHENEFYLEDLNGLKVIDMATQKECGIIESFYENGAQIVLTIKKLDHSILELPLVDNFFPEVDLSQGFILVNIPEFVNE